MTLKFAEAVRGTTNKASLELIAEKEQTEFKTLDDIKDSRGFENKLEEAVNAVIDSVDKELDKFGG